MQADLSEELISSLLWYCGAPSAEFQENIHYCCGELYVLESSSRMHILECTARLLSQDGILLDPVSMTILILKENF